MNTYKTLKMVLFLFAVFCSNSFAQDKLTREKAMDAFTELETDSLVIRFFDALIGTPIQNADVYIDNLEPEKTDFDGRAVFKKPLTDGIVKIKFTHPKYIPSEFEIEIIVGTIYSNRFSISPILPLGVLRIVLDWGEKPDDLDAHLIKRNDYHISYRNMRVSDDGIAKLDKDDTDSYGPETITANSIDKNAEYIFYVHNYSYRNDDDSKVLSNSGACIKIFGDNRLLEVINVPQNISGNFWEVFEIRKGSIIRTSSIKTTVDHD